MSWLCLMPELLRSIFPGENVKFVGPDIQRGNPLYGRVSLFWDMIPALGSGKKQRRPCVAAYIVGQIIPSRPGAQSPEIKGKAVEAADGDI